MRTIITLLITLSAGPALAHIGHLGEVAGHGHWIALGGIAIAAGIAILTGRKDKKSQDELVEDDIEEEEAPA